MNIRWESLREGQSVAEGKRAEPEERRTKKTETKKQDNSEVKKQDSYQTRSKVVNK